MPARSKPPPRARLAARTPTLPPFCPLTHAHQRALHRAKRTNQTTNHYGRFEFRVCPQSAARLSDCSAPLKRADGSGLAAWDLPRVAEGAKFNGGALGDGLVPSEAGGGSGTSVGNGAGGPFAWYRQPHVDCGYWKPCSRFEGTPVYVLKWKLPDGFSCDGCVLHWLYTTGHKCHPPCLKAQQRSGGGGGGGPDCRAGAQYAGTYLATMDYCGSKWAAYPETFYNCADIRIEAKR